jgi:NADH-quinone oxidoreductase subunit J
MPIWLFLFLAALAIISALGVVLQRNPIHCVLALALVLIDIGVLFMGLGAETVGFLQIIVYVGAIMVLFLFVIWLLNIQTEEHLAEGHLGPKFFGAIAAAALLAELFTIFGHTPAAMTPQPLPVDYGSIASLAHLLFSNYLVAFEVTSILLLAAVVGAIALARRVGRADEVVIHRLSSSQTSTSTEKAA